MTQVELEKEVNIQYLLPTKNPAALNPPVLLTLAVFEEYLLRSCKSCEYCSAVKEGATEEV